MIQWTFLCVAVFLLSQHNQTAAASRGPFTKPTTIPLPTVEAEVGAGRQIAVTEAPHAPSPISNSPITTNQAFPDVGTTLLTPDICPNDPTAADVLGPFYIEESPETDKLAPDDQLAVAANRITIEGTIYGFDCVPMANVLVEPWYAGEGDEEGNNYSTAGSKLSYRGRIVTDGCGKYSFTSTFPSVYPQRPIRHIHFRVSEGDVEYLVTQIYFEGFLASGFNPSEEQIVSLREIEDGSRIGTFDVHLDGVTGTASEDCEILSEVISNAPISGAPVSGRPAAPASEAPITIAPSTGAPISGAPVSGSPVSSAPATAEAPVPEPSNAPITGAPISGAPVAVAPASSVPATNSPVVVTPVSFAPVEGVPATDAPTTGEEVVNPDGARGAGICDDFLDRTFSINSGIGRRTRGRSNRDCTWLQGQSKEDRTKYCHPGSEAYDVCEETCGKCSDLCDDVADAVFLVFVEDDLLPEAQDCKWLRERPVMKAKVCVEDHDAFWVCPETCNSCAGEEDIVIREPLDFMFDAVTNRNRSQVADNIFKRDKDDDDAIRTKVRSPRSQG